MVNIGLQLPEGMLDAAIVSRMGTGIGFQDETGVTPITPTRDHAGMSPETIAATSVGMSRQEVQAGVGATRETVGQQDPLAGLDINGTSIQNMQEKTEIGTPQTGATIPQKTGPGR